MPSSGWKHDPRGWSRVEPHPVQALRASRAVHCCIIKSGTRKQEMLLSKEDLQHVYVLRRVLTPLSPVEAMELLLSKMGKTKSDAEFMAAMHT
jgi:transcription termination factor Rho